MSGLLVIVPCLNEAAHLPGLIDLLCADPAVKDGRIVVVDGGSSDESADIVRKRAAIDPRVTLLANPKRLQSAAINLALETYGANADLFVRVDAHAGYPQDYLSRLVQAQKESGADSVVVSMCAMSDTRRCFQRAAACAQNSVLGSGGSPHRKGGGRRWVDHGHHALMRVAAFRAAGGYDESFTHNEDAEFDTRLIGKGGKVLLAADILIDYYPRTTARALARQYFMYGRGRARTSAKHKRPLKPRQLAPVLIAPAILAALFAPLSPWFALPASIWLSACVLFGAALGAKERDFCAIGAGIPAAIMHAAWSAGFLREWIAPSRAPAVLLRTKEA